MNNAKLRAIQDGQSSIARKVLEFVPTEMAVSQHHIFTHMKQVTGTAPAMDILQGCLRALNEARLVKEPRRNYYQRVSIKDPEICRKVVTELENVVAEKQVAPTSPLDRLSALSTKLRAIATEIDDAALDVSEYVAKVEAGTGKLRQLQELLKSIT